MVTIVGNSEIGFLEGQRIGAIVGADVMGFLEGNIEIGDRLGWVKSGDLDGKVETGIFEGSK